jgi:hypothetical protein
MNPPAARYLQGKLITVIAADYGDCAVTVAVPQPERRPAR